MKRETVGFATDEHPKATTAEALARLKPAFRKDGTVTAGNASGLNDGAAAMVLATAEAAETGRAEAAGRACWAMPSPGCARRSWGSGRSRRCRSSWRGSGCRSTTSTSSSSNEAFAAQALAVNKGLGLDPAKVNPNGGAIALGHPVGATGAILTVKALHELERTGGRRGLVTMCIGGGQGIALAIERLDA